MTESSTRSRSRPGRGGGAAAAASGVRPASSGEDAGPDPPVPKSVPAFARRRGSLQGSLPAVSPATRDAGASAAVHPSAGKTQATGRMGARPDLAGYDENGREHVLIGAKFAAGAEEVPAFASRLTPAGGGG